MNNLLGVSKNVIYKNLYIITVISILYYLRYRLFDLRFIKIVSLYILSSIVFELIEKKSIENFWFKKKFCSKIR